MPTDRNNFEKLPFTLVEGYSEGNLLTAFDRDNEFTVTIPLYRYQVVSGSAILGTDFTLVDGQGNPLTSDFGFVYGIGNPAGPQFQQRIIPGIRAITDSLNEDDETFDIFLTDLNSGVVLRVPYKITDTLRSSVTNSLETWEGVRNLTLTGTDDIDGTGNSGNNTITGNSGRNTLTGLAGNDTLIGGGGEDELKGGLGNDTYELNPARSARSQITDTGGTDTLKMTGLTRSSLVSGARGFGRVGTSLIIDLNRDGRVNTNKPLIGDIELTNDLEIVDFFSTETGWQPGSGFIERIGSFSGSSILDLFKLTGKETIEGGSAGGHPLPTVDKNYRNVQFKTFDPSSGRLTTAHRDWTPGTPIWIVIHGWNSNSANFESLARAVQGVRRGDFVLALDWEEAARNFKDGDRESAFQGLNRTAATWIKTVADFAAGKLQAWGVSSGSQLNFIGHSLGSLLSAEIASRFGRANTITALEPPATGLGLYDLDGTTLLIEGPKRFDSVSTFSRAFLGSESIAGNDQFAGWAHESILMDFSQFGDQGQEHGWVIQTYEKLISPNSRSFHLARDLFAPNPNDRGNRQFKRNQYTASATVTFNHEAVIRVTEPDQPVFLTAKRDTGLLSVDDFLYGTNRDDNLTTSDLTALTGNDIIYAGDGNDRLDGGNGNDDLYGDGNDDNLLGGDGQDRLFGGTGNDSLTGNAGDDTLTGGAGADQLVFTTYRAFNAASIGMDTVVGFARGSDRLVLDKDTFTLLTVGALPTADFATINATTNEAATAGASSARIVFNSATGALFYNPNRQTAGLASGGQFARLTGITSLSTTDFIVEI